MRRALGLLERHENVPADRGGVFDRLESWREVFPVVVAEIAVAGAGGNDERVVGQLAFVEDHAAAGNIDLASLGQEHSRVPLPLKSERSGAAMLAGDRRAGRDLVEQRLKQMVISSIDERQLDRRASAGGPCTARQNRRR